MANAAHRGTDDGGLSRKLARLPETFRAERIDNLTAPVAPRDLRQPCCRAQEEDACNLKRSAPRGGGAASITYLQPFTAGPVRSDEATTSSGAPEGWERASSGPWRLRFAGRAPGLLPQSAPDRRPAPRDFVSRTSSTSRAAKGSSEVAGLHQVERRRSRRARSTRRWRSGSSLGSTRSRARSTRRMAGPGLTKPYVLPISSSGSPAMVRSTMSRSRAVCASLRLG